MILAEIEKYFLVFVAGISGIWKGIPLGIGLNLLPLYTGIFTALGSITTVLILFFAGGAFRNRILKLYGKKRIEHKKLKFSKFANRYGPWGLGLVTAGILGPITSMLLGFIFFSDIRKFVTILIAGIFLWSLLFAFFFTPIYKFGISLF